MKLLAESTWRSVAADGIRREDGRSREAKDVVAAKRLGDLAVKLAELAPVALVEDNDHPRLEDWMLGRARDEHAKLLNCRDDDLRVRVAKLALKDGRRRVGICRALLEPVILFYCLVVEIASVNDEEDLVHAFHLRGENRSLERGQCLAAPGRVPDIPAAARRALPAVVLRDDEARNYALCRGDLERTHHQQRLVRVEDAVARQDVQEDVL